MNDNVQNALPVPDVPTDAQVLSVLGKFLSSNNLLNPLKGFKIDLSANRGFRKFFYSANCECGTSAVLSVEISTNKGLAEIEEVAPELIKRLEDRAKTFYDMSCEYHTNMRLGPSSIFASRTLMKNEDINVTRTD